MRWVALWALTPGRLPDQMEQRGGSSESVKLAGVCIRYFKGSSTVSALNSTMPEVSHKDHPAPKDHHQHSKRLQSSCSDTCGHEVFWETKNLKFHLAYRANSSGEDLWESAYIVYLCVVLQLQCGTQEVTTEDFLRSDLVGNWTWILLKDVSSCLQRTSSVLKLAGSRAWRYSPRHH